MGRTIRLTWTQGSLAEINNTTDGANGLPSITSPLTLARAGANLTTIERSVSSLTFSRLLHIAAAGNLILHGLTQRYDTTAAGGAGIYNRGMLTVSLPCRTTIISLPGNYVVFLTFCATSCLFVQKWVIVQSRVKP
jgi:hypothetical protein